MERIKTTYPAFLAVSAGFFLIAAAAYFSKDGGSAHIPLAALGVASLVAYFVSQKAAIDFRLGKHDSVLTVRGGLREAAHMLRAVESARASLIEETAQACTALAS